MVSRSSDIEVSYLDYKPGACDWPAALVLPFVMQRLLSHGSLVAFVDDITFDRVGLQAGNDIMIPRDRQ